tara:strand:+ start:3722 stop:4186 length:465 start_codon:yes stop_codon:yes gene_type:complete
MPEAKTDSRAPRDSESREESKRLASYDPGDMLPSPEPRDGIEYRYVRATSHGRVDNTNYSQAQRAGWTPVKAGEYPELGHVLSDFDSIIPDSIVIGGLVLCKRDASIGEHMKEAAAAESRASIQALDQNYMRDGGQDHRVPKFSDSRSSLKFGD